MKTSLRKINPKVIKFRKYKNFSNGRCKRWLQKNLVTNEIESGRFVGICNKILDPQVLMKKKYLRGKQSSFMNKTILKAIRLRTKLRNIFLKNKSKENKLN